MTLLALAVTGRGLCDPAEPVVRADDEALLRGQAAFETLRVYGGVPFRLDEHLDRLESSAAGIGLPSVALSELEALVALVLDAHGAEPADAVLRLVWTAGPAGEGAQALALLSEIPGWIEEARVRGARVVSLLGVRASAPWLLPGIKSTSYAVNMAAEAEARRRGADDAIFVGDDRIVLEGAVTNVWWRRGGVLLTPSLDLGILAGVTRATILEVAPRCGFRVAEGSYALDEVLAADEAFTTSSVREVMPIAELDGIGLARGPASDRLQQALRALATESSG